VAIGYFGIWGIWRSRKTPCGWPPSC